MLAGYGSGSGGASPTLLGNQNYTPPVDAARGVGVGAASNLTSAWKPDGVTDYNSYVASGKKAGISNPFASTMGTMNNGGQTLKGGATNQGIADWQAYQKYGLDNGYIKDDNESFLGGLAKAIYTNPAIIAAATAGAGAAFAGGGAAAGAGEGTAASLTTDQLLAQSAAGLSPATLGETAAATGAGEVTSTAGASAASGGSGSGGGAGGGGTSPTTAAGQTGTGAGIGSGSAAPAASSNSPAALLKLVGDHASTALTIGSLLGGALGSQSGSGMPDAPSAPPPAPALQGGIAPDAAGITKGLQSSMGPGGADAGNSTTFLTGASGVDPNKLSLGKATLLGG